MKRMHIKKGDTVVVISGANKGDKGEVLKANPKKWYSNRRRNKHGYSPHKAKKHN